MQHSDEFGQIFELGGALGRALPDFTPRKSQRRMAEAVQEALAARARLMVEAGTGTGKTFAYLVPALLSGLRVLISTGTRTLQDQLFTRDLPLVSRAIGRGVKVALLKGRANYLCRHRLLQAGDAPDNAELDLRAAHGGYAPRDNRRGLVAQVSAWAAATRIGDLAELPELTDTHPLRPRISSTRENCLGSRCGEFARCHVFAARRTAAEADIVVVNHHLLLADLALKEDGYGDLLPSADAVILDEAHQIPDLAAQFFGVSLGSRQIETLLHDTRAELRSIAADSLLHAAEQGLLQRLSLLLADLAPRLGVGRWPWEAQAAKLDEHAAELSPLLEEYAQQLEQLDAGEGVAHCAERARLLCSALQRVAFADVDDGARTVEISARSVSLQLLPFDIAPRFTAMLNARPCGWIFTSATLSVGADFSHFANRLGLQEARSLQIASPFDYERQGLLYLPTGMPDPSASDYTAAVCAVAADLVDAGDGGAFVLFTSHRALAHAAQLLRERWGRAAAWPLLVQGEAPREQLLREFRASGHAVLLGTASFWEGVDVKGDALRLVVIDKLPFTSPDDALTRARIQHIRKLGGNAFKEYQLPEAALALKQGVGRLIRSEDDEGVVAICDPRLTARHYGRTLLAALPPLRPSIERDEALRFLRKRRPLRAARVG
ncbi:MAG: ATP-dependent DNA helicase [Steroidobacteraceae bacterium]